MWHTRSVLKVRNMSINSTRIAYLSFALVKTRLLIVHDTVNDFIDEKETFTLA